MKFKCTAWVGMDGHVLVHGDKWDDDVEAKDREPDDVAVTLVFEVPDEWLNTEQRIIVGEVEK